MSVWEIRLERKDKEKKHILYLAFGTELTDTVPPKGGKIKRLFTKMTIFCAEKRTGFL